MLYYSHVNEDSRVERRLLQAANCPTVVVVAGSGERVLALMDSAAYRKFVVVDLNKEALYLLQLKVAALGHLTIEEYLQFCGYEVIEGIVRLRYFDTIKGTLLAACRQYWEERRPLIAKGIVYAGHFEQFLGRIRPFLNAFLGKSFQQLLTSSDLPATFPALRWKIIRWLFAQKWVYRLWGNRDAAFIGAAAHTGHIPAALQALVERGEFGASFMAHLIFKGHLRCMKEKDLPPSVRKDTLGRIQRRLRRHELTIQYVTGDLLDFISYSAPEGPVFYSLSDILSFEGFAYLQQVVEKIAAPRNVVVGRSFLQHRLASPQCRNLTHGERTVALHDAEESSGMYQVFSVAYEKQDFIQYANH